MKFWKSLILVTSERPDGSRQLFERITCSHVIDMIYFKMQLIEFIQSIVRNRIIIYK